MKTEIAKQEDADALASLRAIAMRESLETIGRYDPIRVKERFLSTFNPLNTAKIISKGDVDGFYVTVENSDHILLDHIYIHPNFQGNKFGSFALKEIISLAKKKGKPVRLVALKGSRSNSLYKAHGFIKTHEEEYDNYYELNHS